ncbi:MAG: RICIN domain-containing protein [Clostridia bacterium]|nr:RICIN domain-containing protein [Clostridia bacterium]
MKKIFSLAVVLTMGMTTASTAFAQEEENIMYWQCTTDSARWVDKGTLSATLWDNDTELYINVDPSTRYQTLSETPFGGCFNERGWEAMKELSQAEKEAVISNLFSEEGLNLSAGRMALGNSDFSINRSQSYDELPEGVETDYNLDYFSIDSDREYMLPYIEAAEKVRPDLPIWGSPWSPPSWMKNNKTIYGQHGDNTIIWTDEILKTYAQYFVKYVEAYRAEGHNVYMVMPQNEPTMNTAYSSCVWTGEQLNVFIRDYLYPAFQKAGLSENTDIYLGTFTDSQANRTDPTLNDPVTSSIIKGVGFQWWSAPLATRVHRQFPHLHLMQSETKCGNGANNWQYAEEQFDCFKEFFDAGVSSYMLWNMILDEKGENTSPNPWHQNAPIVVHSETNEVIYTPHYYLVKHFSHYIKPGARRIKTEGNYGDKIAFQNPDGEVILVVKNSADSPFAVAINVGGKKVKPIVPANSISTFRIMADNDNFTTSPDMSLTENSKENEEVTIKLHAYIGGRTLSVHSASFDNGAKAIGWTDQGTADQSWTLEPTEDGCYRLLNYNSLKVLGVYGGSTAKGAECVQWDWDQTLNQQWRFEPVFKNGSTYYKIVNRGSGLCLSFNGSGNDGCQAVQTEYSGDNELWDITCMTGELFSDKFIIGFSDAKTEEACITVTANSKISGDYTVICAFVNNYGAVISTETKTITFNGTDSVSVSFDKVTDCFKAYIYSWDEKTLTPLSKKCTVD